MKMFKKATLSMTVKILLIAVGLLLLVPIIITILADASDEGDVLRCKLSVLERALLKDPLFGGSLGSLRCNTQRRRVGQDSNDQEEVMREISDYLVRCWNMFGEGVLRSLRSSDGFWVDARHSLDLFGRYSGRAFCFICYDLDIRDLDKPITDANLFSFFDNTLYLADSTVSCPPGDLDCENMRKDLTISPCERRGGVCRPKSEGCDMNTEVKSRENEDWRCFSSNSVCCLDRRDVYTYHDYLRYHSGTGGTLLLFSESFPIVKGEKYGIIYIEPADETVPSYIAIGDFTQIAASGCIQR